MQNLVQFQHKIPNHVNTQKVIYSSNPGEVIFTISAAGAHEQI